MANELQFEKSPYLLQHAENPVDWRPWGADAFDAARRADKPVFLSIGYSTCHWCHVMARESFEDAAVAAALNRDFISVKVDREERPDVDAVYMAACVALSGSGGWPLTALLTPDQKPFWAGTYLPKRRLLSLLDRAAALWREDRAGLTAAGEELTAHLRREEPPRALSPSRALLEAAGELFARGFDPRWGGFGAAPKFPAPHNLIFLLRYGARTGRSEYGDMAERTLEAMYRGGLFDHAGGGFARYSTDDKWLVPHFEKMLYDNALLAMAYTEAYRRTGRAYYAAVARRTLDYALDELRGAEGGFCCGQDADSEGVEGKFYVFTPRELSQVLGDADARAFCRWYGVTAAGNFEGKSILNLMENPDWEREPPGMAALRERVRAYRLGRTALHRDDKVLTAWNSLMLSALAQAGRVLDEPRYLGAAEETAAFLAARLTGENGRLLARWRGGEAAHPGKLDDYAFYAWALLELYAATLALPYLTGAIRAASALLELFFDPRNGGFFPYARDGEQLISRNRETYDGAMPSGNSVAGLALSRLSRLTGEEKWRAAAELQLRYLAGAAAASPAGHAFALLPMLEELWPAGELVCATAEGSVPAELLEFLAGREADGLAVLVKTAENAAALAQAAPFTAGYALPQAGSLYYLCQNRACRPPVRGIKELRLL